MKRRSLILPLLKEIILALLTERRLRFDYNAVDKGGNPPSLPFSLRDLLNRVIPSHILVRTAISQTEAECQRYNR
jgi:hypothetical protein